MVKNVIKGSFPISKVLVFEGNSYVCGKNEDIRKNGKECDQIWKVLVFEGILSVEKMKILGNFMMQMVKNVIKGSFPISKVLVFEGNSYVC